MDEQRSVNATETQELTQEEISELCWTPLDNAGDMVSFSNDKRLIRLARRRLGLPELPEAPAKKPAVPKKA